MVWLAPFMVEGGAPGLGTEHEDWCVVDEESGAVELVRYDALYHELFNEPEQETVFARMEEWLAARAQPMPATWRSTS